MESFESLYTIARENRDAAIREAGALYLRKLEEIDRLLRSLGECRTTRPRYSAAHSAVPEGHSLRGLTTHKAAEVVLRDRQPLTAVEITVEIQRRGSRSGADPHTVARSVRSALSYHRGRFRRDDSGRCFLLE